MQMVPRFDIKVRGRLIRTARLQNEYYEFVSDPAELLKVGGAAINADIFTFLPEFHQRTPVSKFYWEPDSIAVIPLTTYEHWWKQQISDKTRNMARKAGKKGVEV